MPVLVTARLPAEMKLDSPLKRKKGLVIAASPFPFNLTRDVYCEPLRAASAADFSTARAPLRIPNIP
jgi:hypothetical protein